MENGLPLGLFYAGTYSAVEVPVAPGDKVVLCTDGILETRSPSEQEFGLDLFKGFLESNHGSGAEIFADSFLGELFGWSEHPQGQGQEDDLTLLVIDFGTPSDSQLASPKSG
jgi:serine phosphatase RsbU (regulator of sigma subunit)